MFVGRRWLHHGQGLDLAEGGRSDGLRTGAPALLGPAHGGHPLGLWPASRRGGRPGRCWRSRCSSSSCTRASSCRWPGACSALLHREPLTAVAGLRPSRGDALVLCGDLAAGRYRRAGALARGTVGAGADTLALVIAAYALAYVAGMAAFVVPSGVGVREAVLAGALRAEVGGPVALAWAVLLRLWQTAIEVVFVGLVLLAERLSRRGAAQAGARSTGRLADDEAGAEARRACRDGGALAAPPRARRRAHARRVRRASSAATLSGWRSGAVAFAAVYALLAYLKYRNYDVGRYDLGNMVQAVYNTAHGRFLEITTNDMAPRQMSRLGSHVDPILALFALPWLVWPSPVMLLTLQSVIVAAGGLAGLPPRHARHPRPARRGPARRRLPALPGARLRGAQRVPPGDAGHDVPALRLPLPRGGPLALGDPVHRARRALQGGDPARRGHSSAATSPCASARGGRCSSPPPPWSTSSPSCGG